MWCEKSVLIDDMKKDWGNAMNELKPVDVLYASNYVSMKWKSQIKCCVNDILKIFTKIISNIFFDISRRYFV